MTLLVIGGGQLAQALQATQPKGLPVVYLPRALLDITDGSAVDEAFRRLKPRSVINTAAYTAVDRAEAEPDRAYAVNHYGAKNVAQSAAKRGAQLLHVSTDFVFDGQQQLPYCTSAIPNPLNVYGASKLAGEQAVLHACEHAVVVRTSWLYSAYGSNFMKTMLRLMAEKPELNIVNDQMGSPTWANGLASLLWAATEHPLPVGVYHWSDAGTTTWFGFASEIQQQAIELGILKKAIPLHGIPSEQYPTPAKRPCFSALSNAHTERLMNFTAQPWRTQLQTCLKGLSDYH